MEKYTFFHCSECDGIVTREIGSKDQPMCKGKPMEKLVPQIADSTKEKHVPVITIEGDKVTVIVGSTPHPMVEKHYITRIHLVTSKGMKHKLLTPEDEEAIAHFKLEDGEKVEGAYEYCNLHGLWYAEI